MAEPVAERMQQGVEEGVFPGAVLLVWHQSQIIHYAAYGHASLLPHPEPASCETVYDLASLTKPLAAVSAAVLMTADGRIDLDSRLERYIPGLEQKELCRATVRQLLNHAAGLPAWRPFYERIVPDGRRLREKPVEARRRAIYEAIRHEPLVEPVGARSLYSDLGFILLGEMLERVSGKDWASLCHEEVFPRLGFEGLFYMSETGPTGGVSISNRVFAATEQDEWRGRLLRGEVHDEHAAVMGGVSSHAGLFGTARAVLDSCRVWLATVRGDSSSLPRQWAQQFTYRQHTASESSWALGWDTPSLGPAGEPSSSGRFFSASSFGHLGFTGSSVWIDPERNLIVVLLTNRVHPSRQNNRIRQFRPTLHDTVIKTLPG
ncbi:MAG TPA: serine hydrolase domain-containing protein [Nitrospirales bacterium]